MDSSTTEPSAPQRHERFYFDDGNAIFLVNNKLFKLHRSFLCQDPESLFKSLFLVPTPQTSDTTRATAETNALEHIPIHDVDDKVFTILVRMLYASAIGAPTDTAASLPVAEWIPFFELVDRFCMDSLIQYAVKNITSIPVESMKGDLSSRFLHLAIRFTTSFTTEYRNSLFRHILARDDSLSETEMEMLGWKLSARVSHLRERLRAAPPSSLQGLSCGCAGTNLYCYNCSCSSTLNPVIGTTAASNYPSLLQSAAQHSMSG